MKRYRYYTVEDTTIGKEPVSEMCLEDVDVEIVFYLVDSLDEEESPWPQVEAGKFASNESPIVTESTLYTRDILQTRSFWLNHFNLYEINQKITELAYELMQKNQKETAKLLGITSRNISNWVRRQS